MLRLWLVLISLFLFSTYLLTEGASVKEKKDKDDAWAETHDYRHHPWASGKDFARKDVHVARGPGMRDVMVTDGLANIEDGTDVYICMDKRTRHVFLRLGDTQVIDVTVHRGPAFHQNLGTYLRRDTFTPKDAKESVCQLVGKTTRALFYRMIIAMRLSQNIGYDYLTNTCAVGAFEMLSHLGLFQPKLVLDTEQMMHAPDAKTGALSQHTFRVAAKLAGVAQPELISARDLNGKRVLTDYAPTQNIDLKTLIERATEGVLAQVKAAGEDLKRAQALIDENKRKANYKMSQLILMSHLI